MRLVMLSFTVLLGGLLGYQNNITIQPNLVFGSVGSPSEAFIYDGSANTTMTLSGIESLGQAFRGYTDPPGYADASGKRIESLDLYHDTSYNKVWAAMFNGLQGDLNYPSLADNHPPTAAAVISDPIVAPM